MEAIRVYLWASDPISMAGLAEHLRPCADLELVGLDDLARAQVGLAVADNVDDGTICALRGMRRGGVRRLVVVVRTVHDADLVVLAEIGVAGLVWRAEATAERLVGAIRSAGAGEGSMPPDLLGRLLVQVGQVQRQVLAPRGVTFSGLSEREVEVLRLVAEGWDTAEIAEKLAYSQRTIKNVVHNITIRMQVRNRCHAVAYALRRGLI